MQDILPRFISPAEGRRPVYRCFKKPWTVCLVIGSLFTWAILDRWSADSGSAAPVIGTTPKKKEIAPAREILNHTHPTAKRWAPIILDRPLDNMPTHFAPFIAASIGNPDDIYGEELLYPDFAIPMPIFAEDEHRRRWMSETEGISGRATLVDGQDYFQYKGQHGQNFASRFSSVFVCRDSKLIDRGYLTDSDQHHVYSADVV
jgi:hypothetical protein